MENKFEQLLSLNVNDKTETRKSANGKVELTYLSWAWAWSEFKKVYPDAQYEIKKFKNENEVFVPYMYDELTGYMVMTSVTADNITYEMWLPVMNSNNKAMKSESYSYKTKNGEFTVEAADMFDINKTIMRCLVKNLAMFGLGLYIYAGEDLPEQEQKEKQEQAEQDIYSMIDDFDDAEKLKEFYTKYLDVVTDTKRFTELVNAKGKSLKKVA